MGSSHSHVNTIANAYCHDIWVKTATDKQYVAIEDWGAKVHYGKAGASVHHHAEYDTDRCRKDGFTRVARNGVLRMHPDTHDRHTVYVTIMGSNGRVISHCYPTSEDGGVIVSARGYLKESVRGNAWKDYSGKIH